MSSWERDKFGRSSFKFTIDLRKYESRGRIKEKRGVYRNIFDSKKAFKSRLDRFILKTSWRAKYLLSEKNLLKLRIN